MTDWSIDVPGTPDTREEELQTTYRALVAAQTVRRQGETVPLRRLHVDLESPERRRRERAWRLASGRWLEDAPAISELWRALVSIRAEKVSDDGDRSYPGWSYGEMGDASTASEAARRAQLAVEEFVTSVLVRLHERRRLQLGLRTIRPWDLYAAPPGLPVDPLFATECDVAEAVNRALSGVQYGSGVVLPTRAVSIDSLQSDLEVEDLLAGWGETVVQADVTDSDLARVALPLLVLHGTEVAREGESTPTPRHRARIRHLERRLLSWTFGAMLDAFEAWAYSHPDQAQDEDMTGATWSSLWLRFLPAVDWAGLPDILMVEWQRHDALFLRPGLSISRISRELEIFKAWSGAKESHDWFQRLGITDRAEAHPRRIAPVIDDQDLLDVARWLEDAIEELEGDL